MARFDMGEIYGEAKKRVRPTYRRLRRYDVDDWLSTIGLERRNTTRDVFAGLGILAIGCAVGVFAGLWFAPKRGIEFRSDVNERLRGMKADIKEQVSPPTYAS